MSNEVDVSSEELKRANAEWWKYVKEELDLGSDAPSMMLAKDPEDIAKAIREDPEVRSGKFEALKPGENLSGERLSGYIAANVKSREMYMMGLFGWSRFYPSFLFTNDLDVLHRGLIQAVAEKHPFYGSLYVLGWQSPEGLMVKDFSIWAAGALMQRVAEGRALDEGAKVEDEHKRIRNYLDSRVPHKRERNRISQVELISKLHSKYGLFRDPLEVFRAYSNVDIGRAMGSKSEVLKEIAGNVEENYLKFKISDYKIRRKNADGSISSVTY